MRLHRGPAFAFSAPGIDIELRLTQSNPGWPHDVYMTVVAAPAFGEAGVTLAVDDIWRLLDLASGLLEQIR
jgi:hypothetical protein